MSIPHEQHMEELVVQVSVRDLQAGRLQAEMERRGGAGPEAGRRQVCAPGLRAPELEHLLCMQQPLRGGHDPHAGACCLCRYGVGKWLQIQKDDALGPQLINRSNVDLKVRRADRPHCLIMCPHPQHL